MKKASIKKLQLRKDVVVKLGKSQMDQVIGGVLTYSCVFMCTEQPTIFCNTELVECPVQETYLPCVLQ